MSMCGKKIRQSAGVFVRVNDEFLVLFRKKDSTWGIPGGRVEEGETYERAAWRELFEETGIWRMSHHSFQDLGVHKVRDCSGGEWLYAVFELRLPLCPEVTLEQEKHGEYRWVSPGQFFEESSQDVPIFPGMTQILIDVGYISRSAPDAFKVPSV